MNERACGCPPTHVLGLPLLAPSHAPSRPGRLSASGRQACEQQAQGQAKRDACARARRAGERMAVDGRAAGLWAKEWVAGRGSARWGRRQFKGKRRPVAVGGLMDARTGEAQACNCRKHRTSAALPVCPLGEHRSMCGSAGVRAFGATTLARAEEI